MAQEKLARKREHSLATSPTHSGDEMDIDREAKVRGEREEGKAWGCLQAWTERSQLLLVDPDYVSCL